MIPAHWHSIGHIFWQSIWHSIWHLVWHIFWHLFGYLFWHFTWHMFGSRRAPASAPGAEEDEGGAAPLLKSRDPHLAGNNIPSLRIGQFHPQPAPILCCLCFQLLLLPLKVPQPFRQLRSRGHRQLGVGLQKILLVAKFLGPGKSWVFGTFWTRKMLEGIWSWFISMVHGNCVRRCEK